MAQTSVAKPTPGPLQRPLPQPSIVRCRNRDERRLRYEWMPRCASTAQPACKRSPRSGRRNRKRQMPCRGRIAGGDARAHCLYEWSARLSPSLSPFVPAARPFVPAAAHSSLIAHHWSHFQSWALWLRKQTIGSLRGVSMTVGNNGPADFLPVAQWSGVLSRLNCRWSAAPPSQGSFIQGDVGDDRRACG